MTELPKTEQELNDLIASKVKEETDKLTAKHNGEMATQRKKFDDDLKKAKEQANMSAEEIAQQKIKEQQEAKDQELNELRAYKKQSIIGEKLAKENLPSFLKNDARLLNAEDGNIDKVVKDIKKEYEASLPKGATHSTVVNTNGKGANSGTTDKELAMEKMGEALKQIVEQ